MSDLTEYLEGDIKLAAMMIEHYHYSNQSVDSMVRAMRQVLDEGMPPEYAALAGGRSLEGEPPESLADAIGHMAVRLALLEKDIET